MIARRMRQSGIVSALVAATVVLLAPNMGAATYALLVCAGWALGLTVLVVVAYAVVEPSFRDECWKAGYRSLVKLARVLAQRSHRAVRLHGNDSRTQMMRTTSMWMWNVSVWLDPRRSHWLSVRAGVLDWDCAATNEVRCGGHMTARALTERAESRARLAEHSITDESPDRSPVLR